MSSPENPLPISTLFLTTFHRHQSTYIASLPITLSSLTNALPLGPIFQTLAEERSRVSSIGTKIVLRAARHILRNAARTKNTVTDSHDVILEPQIWMDITATVGDVPWMRGLYKDLSSVKGECEVEMLYLAKEIKKAEAKMEEMKKERAKEGGKGTKGGKGVGKKVHFQDECPGRTG